MNSDKSTMSGTEWYLENDAVQLAHINEQHICELTREDLLRMLNALDIHKS